MPLTPEQARELQILIERRIAALLDELEEEIVRVRQGRFEDRADRPRDQGDESVATLIADLESADVGRDVDELRALQAARTRMAEGHYGICASCDREIGFDRLRANPAAVRCIECQTQHEKTYGAPGGPSL
jgi:DnaK suppressor protein